MNPAMSSCGVSGLVISIASERNSCVGMSVSFWRISRTWLNSCSIVCTSPANGFVMAAGPTWMLAGWFSSPLESGSVSALAVSFGSK